MRSALIAAILALFLVVVWATDVTGKVEGQRKSAACAALSVFELESVV